MTRASRLLSEQEVAALPAAEQFVTQQWDLAYRHAVGTTVERFFGGLKAKRLVGRRCASCNRVLVPPRSFCDRCHCDVNEWIEVAQAGEITMFTIVYEPFKGMPEPPYAMAYVLLDGADTALLGYVQGVDLSVPADAAGRLQIGTRVKVHFTEAPIGRVTDYWFELADSEDGN